MRGDLDGQLSNKLPNVSNDSEQLLKFHGIYAQDQRDVRRARAQAGETLDYIFMIRVVVPGGRLRASDDSPSGAVSRRREGRTSRPREEPRPTVPFILRWLWRRREERGDLSESSPGEREWAFGRHRASTT